MDLQKYKISQQEREQNGVVSAKDTLTGTARENKSVFDRLVGFFVDRYNQLVDAMQQFSGTNETEIARLDTKINEVQTQLNSKIDETTIALSDRIHTAQTTATAAVYAAAEADAKAMAAKAQADSAKADAGTAISAASAASLKAEEALRIVSTVAGTAQDALFTAQQAKKLAESVAILRDPVTGLYAPIQTVIENIFYAFQSPINAGELDTLNLTAGQFDVYSLTAYEFDTRAKLILTGGG